MWQEPVHLPPVTLSLPLSLFHLSYLALCRVSFPCNVTEFGYCFLQRCSTVISVAAKHTHTHAYTPMHWCMQRCRSHLAADFASLIDASNLPKFRTIRFFSYSNLIYFVFSKKIVYAFVALPLHTHARRHCYRLTHSHPQTHTHTWRAKNHIHFRNFIALHIIFNALTMCKPRRDV